MPETSVYDSVSIDEYTGLWVEGPQPRESVGIGEYIGVRLPGTIVFSYGNYSVTVNKPQYGYTVDIYLNMIKKLLGTGKLNWWDNGSSNDYRVFRTEFLLNENQHKGLFDFFNDPKKGRGNNITLSLGNSATGFFPAGPDKGDQNDFTIQLIQIKDSGILWDPWLYFKTDISFSIIETPSYALPSRTGYEEGGFNIGTIDDLRFPLFEPFAERGYKTELTRDGTPKIIDRGEYGDGYNTRWIQRANQPNAAAIIDHIVGAVRGNAFDIDNSVNIYPFGIFANEGPGITIDAKLFNNVISVVHEDYDDFKISFEANLDTVT